MAGSAARPSVPWARSVTRRRPRRKWSWRDYKTLDPQVRAAAVESVGQWGETSAAVLCTVLLLLDDANDQVKVEVTKVLPKLAGATPEVIDGLCRRLLEDDSDWVQVYAALALGKLGPAAAAAGATTAPRRPDRGSERTRTSDASDRHDPTSGNDRRPLAAGLKDACGDIRRVASAGWMNATAISEEAIPALIEALRDPEVQVRANSRTRWPGSTSSRPRPSRS